MSVCIYTLIYTHVYIYICVYIGVYIYTRVYICVYNMGIYNTHICIYNAYVAIVPYGLIFFTLIKVATLPGCGA